MTSGLTSKNAYHGRLSARVASRRGVLGVVASGSRSQEVATLSEGLDCGDWGTYRTAAFIELDGHLQQLTTADQSSPRVCGDPPCRKVFCAPWRTRWQRTAPGCLARVAGGLLGWPHQVRARGSLVAVIRRVLGSSPSGGAQTIGLAFCYLRVGTIQGRWLPQVRDNRAATPRYGSVARRPTLGWSIGEASSDVVKVISTGAKTG